VAAACSTRSIARFLIGIRLWSFIVLACDQHLSHHQASISPLQWLGPMGKSARPKPSPPGFFPACARLLAVAPLQKTRRLRSSAALRPKRVPALSACPFQVRHRGEIAPWR
jgi:hypothetical protein